MARRTGLVVLAALLATAAFARSADACSCRSSGPVCQAYWKTDAVFDATVVGITPLDDNPRGVNGDIRFADKIVKLDVRQRWKGDVSPGPLEMTTTNEGGGCGFPFREGKRYLVFAFRGGLDARLQASICSLTQEFDGRGPAADFLASLDKAPQSARIFGTVTTFIRRFDNASTNTSSPTETTVKLSGDGGERTARSVGGRYEFSGLRPGAYRVELVVPEGHTTYGPTRDVEIVDPRGCAEERFSLSPAGRITGRLVGPNGRPLTRVQVEVTTTDAQTHALYGLPIHSGYTIDGGFFEVTQLPPGRYIVGVNLKDLPNQYNPYARTVYSSTGHDPDVLDLSLGQTIDLGTWEMPAPPPVVRINGIVTWSDGTPAQDVYVGVWDRTGNPVERARGAGGSRSAVDGRFTLEVRQGRIYTLTARDSRGGIVSLVSPVRIDTSSALPEVIRLAIRKPGENPK